MTSLFDALNFHRPEHKLLMKYHELKLHLDKMQALSKEMALHMALPPTDGPMLMCGYCLTRFPTDGIHALIEHCQQNHPDLMVALGRPCDDGYHSLN